MLAQEGTEMVLDRPAWDQASSLLDPPVIYAGLGEKDQAFTWLERAYADPSYLLALYLTTDARLDTLHSDPRFSELRRRIGLPALDRRG
jgi:hypothetical protein